MKKCPKCGGTKFEYHIQLHQIYTVTPRGGLYTPPQEIREVEWHSCAACGTQFNSWEDIPDA